MAGLGTAGASRQLRRPEVRLLVHKMALGDVSTRSGYRKGDCALHRVGRGRRWRRFHTRGAHGGLGSVGVVRTLRGCAPTPVHQTHTPTVYRRLSVPRWFACLDMPKVRAMLSKKKHVHRAGARQGQAAQSSRSAEPSDASSSARRRSRGAWR
eukprot:5509265-Prymnesium_polylepis.1